MSEHVKELKIKLDIEQERSFNLAEENKALQTQLDEVLKILDTLLSAQVLVTDVLQAKDEIVKLMQYQP